MSNKEDNVPYVPGLLQDAEEKAKEKEAQVESVMNLAAIGPVMTVDEARTTILKKSRHTDQKKGDAYLTLATLEWALQD